MLHRGTTKWKWVRDPPRVFMIDQGARAINSQDLRSFSTVPASALSILYSNNLADWTRSLNQVTLIFTRKIGVLKLGSGDNSAPTTTTIICSTS